MRWDGFGTGILFAALAAALFPAFALLLGREVTGPYLVGVGALYAAAIAPRLSRAVTVGVLAAVLGTLVLLLATSASELAIGLALVVGLCRSGVLYRARPARALLYEGLLLVGGLALARFLAAPGALGTALAIWGFFLVQSLYFLIGGREPRSEVPEGLDPFEVARARALAIMEEELR